MRRFSTLLLSIVALVLWSTTASAGAFALFDGIQGGSLDPNYKGWSSVLSFDWQLTVPIARSSGRATGKRQHKPVSIVKPIDQATPLLMGRCSDGAVIPKVEINLTRPNRDGRSEPYLVVVLTNVRISSYTIHGSDSEEPDDPQQEQLTVTYESIVCEYIGRTGEREEYSDDWAGTK